MPSLPGTGRPLALYDTARRAVVTTAAPEIPPDVVEATRARYIEAYQRITGQTWTDGVRAA